MRTDFFLILLAQLTNFQAHLLHLTLQLPDTTIVFADRAQYLGVHTLAVQQAITRDVALAGQFAQALQLLVQCRALQHFIGLRVTHPAQLRLGSGDAFADALLIEQQRLTPAGEQLLLQCQVRRHFGLVMQRHQLSGETHTRSALNLGIEPGLAGQRAIKLAAQRLRLTQQRGFLEPDQYLPRLHTVAITHVDALNNPATGMLHHFAIARHHDLARHRDAFVQRRQSSPGKKPEKPAEHQQPTQARMATVVQLQHVTLIGRFGVCGTHALFASTVPSR